MVVSLVALKFRVIMGEATSVRSPRKTFLGHLRTVKQLITVALDLKTWRVDPVAFQSFQLNVFRIFYVSNQRSAVQVVKSQNDQETWPNSHHSLKQ